MPGSLRRLWLTFSLREVIGISRSYYKDSFGGRKINMKANEESFILKVNQLVTLADLAGVSARGRGAGRSAVVRTCQNQSIASPRVLVHFCRDHVVFLLLPRRFFSVLSFSLPFENITSLARVAFPLCFLLYSLPISVITLCPGVSPDG